VTRSGPTGPLLRRGPRRSVPEDAEAIAIVQIRSAQVGFAMFRPADAMATLDPAARVPLWRERKRPCWRDLSVLRRAGVLGQRRRAGTDAARIGATAGVGFRRGDRVGARRQSARSTLLRGRRLAARRCRKRRGSVRSRREGASSPYFHPRGEDGGIEPRKAVVRPNERGRAVCPRLNAMSRESCTAASRLRRKRRSSAGPLRPRQGRLSFTSD
jgi:hypothetical protein